MIKRPVHDPSNWTSGEGEKSEGKNRILYCLIFIIFPFEELRALFLVVVFLGGRWIRLVYCHRSQNFFFRLGDLSGRTNMLFHFFFYVKELGRNSYFWLF